ncbi:hypothetical protein C8J57DRAFT_1355976 [Mycena rebaudengoi]|nr:hypothetical protein C8J57DRAFT_1362807 [Mycena rebaudengoi]KAJ7249925.1 hypothetical protein C8J57DRAFT_1355976 [Mycena rebaudengoi]
MQAHPAQRPIPVLPPDAPDPDLGGLIGVPMHITTSGHPHCEHRACQRHCGYNPGYTVGSEPGKTIEHLVTNVCARYGAYRRADALPRDLQGRVEATEYTFQYSDMKDDMSTWLFRAQTPVAIIHPPNFGHTLITSTDQPRRMSMTMRDMTMHRPGYTVVHLMEATWGHGDAGSFGWYQYDNGAIRVCLHSLPPSSQLISIPRLSYIYPHPTGIQLEILRSQWLLRGRRVEEPGQRALVLRRGRGLRTLGGFAVSRDHHPMRDRSDTQAGSDPLHADILSVNKVGPPV